MNVITKGSVVKSLSWKFSERLIVQGIQFVVTILLARLLSPAEYGIIAIVLVFVQLATVIVEGGFNTALIQKKKVDNVDFSTVFFSTLVITAILYLVLFILAKPIAEFYDIPILKTVLRVLSLTLFLDAVNSVQMAYMSRNMMFKMVFYSSFAGTFMSGVVGILMAYLGYGIWSLVGQTLTSRFFITLVMWFKLKWRPDFVFSWSRFKSLFEYGWKIFASNLVITLFQNIRSLLIGKMYDKSALGFFDRGRQFPSLLINNINGTIQAILLPVYSQSQDDIVKVKAMLRRSIKTSNLIVLPIMVTLIAIARPMIILLLTEKWLPAVPFIQIFALAYMLMPIQSANGSVIKALGYSNIFMKLEFFKIFIDFIILFISVQINVTAVAWGIVLYNFLCLFINLYPNRKLINYGYREQFKDIIPEMLVAVFMGVIVYSIQFLPIDNMTIILLFQIICGIIIYFALCNLFKLESYKYVYDMIIPHLKKYIHRN